MENKSERMRLMEEVRKKSNELRNRIFLGRDPEVVSINSFPEVWEEFFPGQRQMIRGVTLPSGSEAIMVIYHSEEAGDFNWHIHENADEHIFVVKGEVIIEEPTGKTAIRRGENYCVKADVAHYAKFMPDTVFSIVWTGSGSDFLRFKFSDNTTKAKVQ